MKKIFLALLCLISVSVKADDKPWTFWYWMYGAVSEEGIRADLKAMKDVGLAGAYLMPIRSVTEKPEYQGQAEQLTPGFWHMVDYAMHTADSLGLQIGVHICDGFALAGGPWFTPEESMQKVVWSDTIISLSPLSKRDAKKAKAPQLITLPVSGSGYKDIAAYAIPVSNKTDELHPVALTYTSNVESTEKNIIRANEPCSFTFQFEGEMPRAVEISPAGTNIQCQRLKVEYSIDNKNFTYLTDLKPARQGWQNTSCATTFALPAVTSPEARYLRFSWTPEGTEPGSEDLDAAKWKPTLRLKNMRFFLQPRIHQWEGKASMAWRVDSETTNEQVSYDDCVLLHEILPLTIASDGSIDISSLLPMKGQGERHWRIMRFGHCSTGQTNATAGGGKGLECDKFSVAAVNKLIDNWFGKFAEMPSAKDVLTCLHVDSWECGCQNWSNNFADEFKKRRGYDLLDYLPVMAGIPVQTAAESERVLRDVRLTINDLVNEVFFATVRDRAHSMGMLFSSESIAPTFVADGMDHYRYSDLPMGEYWLNSPTHDKPNDMLDAISGAHIYGKNIVQAEGFTEVRGVWDETPASIKTLLDRNLALGMNRLFFHVNTHNPWMDRKPGMTLDGIGLFFQRDQTWFPEAKPFVDYITRCQTLLQQGRPVQDIAVFTGEEMPRRSILPERLVPMLPGIFGEERVASEAARLKNEGEPMQESPVGVNHSAGIVDTKDWVNALNGYQYDSFNPDVLLNLAKVEDGHIVLPGGARYRVLVLPQSRPMTPSQKLDDHGHAMYSDAVMKKIDELRKGGVAIVDEPFLEPSFMAYGLEQDVIVPVDIAYTHRASEKGEIYFLSNQSEVGRDMEISFRLPYNPKGYPKNILPPHPATEEALAKWRKMVSQTNETPYIYYPATNSYKRLEASYEGNRIATQLCLDAYGSAFVIFPVADTADDILSCLDVKPVNENECKPRTFAEVTLLKDFILTAREMEMQPVKVHIEDFMNDQTIWNDVPEMKFFSGHATYTTTAKIKKVTGTEMLELSIVKDLAHIWVNGIDCGVAWTFPYALPIGHALKKGSNEIRIEVVNTWANALRGMDEGTPPYPGIWTNARYRMKAPHLLPAGLVAPVRITQ